MSAINIICIGCGQQLHHVYIKAIVSLQAVLEINICAFIDYDDILQTTAISLGSFVNPIELLPIHRETSNIFQLTPEEITNMNRIKEAHSIRAAIISTEPSSHMAYLEWAISQGVNILIDKPPVLFPGCSYDFKSAQLMKHNFLRLTDKGVKAVDWTTHRPLVISCMTQRRYSEYYIRRLYMYYKIQNYHWRQKP